jgi:hypothetical protein
VEAAINRFLPSVVARNGRHPRRGWHATARCESGWVVSTRRTNGEAAYVTISKLC